MIGVREAAGLGQIARIRVRDGSGLHIIASGKIRDGSGLSAFFASMAATASPNSVSGYGNSGDPSDILTGNTFCVVTGGVPPYTYLWEEVAATGTWNITQPTNDFTGFEAEAVDPIDTRDAEFKCTVTDDTGETAETNIVFAHAINLGG